MRSRMVLVAFAISVTWVAAWALWQSRSVAALDEIGKERGELVQEKYALLRAYSWRGHSEPWVNGTDVMSGAPISLGDTYQGLVYVIHSQCPHCAGNLPWLARFADQGIPVTLVAVDTIVADVERWIDANSVQLPVVRGPTGRLLPLIEAAGYPYTLVLWDGALGLGALGAVREDRVLELESEMANRD